MNKEIPLGFVSAVGLADLLGVKTRHVRLWARKGKIPKLVLPNGRFVFDSREVIEFLRAGERLSVKGASGPGGDSDEQG